MSDRLTYRITELAGDWVAGYRRPKTQTVQLTPEEAEYDLRVGTLVLVGPPPVEPVPPVVLLKGGDFVRTLRDRAERNVTIEAFETFLTRDGGMLDGYFEQRGDAIGVAIAGAVDQRLASLEALARAQATAVVAGVFDGTVPSLGLKALLDRITDAEQSLTTANTPAGRREAFRRLRDALPTSPDGLDAGEPWLNGDGISFVPSA